MRIVIAPDKFKGSIDSISLCTLIHKEIDALYPDATVDSFPLSDGGDGFTQIVQHYFKTKAVSTQTVDPLGGSYFVEQLTNEVEESPNVDGPASM